MEAKNPTLKDLTDAAARSESGISVERIGDNIIIKLEQPYTYVEIHGHRYQVADIY